MKGQNKPTVVNVDISDVMSPQTCGLILIEIIKYLVHQKQQIPFTYDRLKDMVSKKREIGEESENSRPESLASKKYFRVASTSVDIMESIFTKILNEIESCLPPEEVCLILGATPVSSREVYRIVLPELLPKSQYTINSSRNGQKLGMSVLRDIATSDVLATMTSLPLPPTNMYLLIKRAQTESICNLSSLTKIDDANIFVPFNGCRFTKTTRLALIQLKLKTASSISFNIFEEEHSGLSKLHIDSDDGGSECDKREYLQNMSKLESCEEFQWFQSAVIFKGFKDSFANGSSITNLWLKNN